MVKHGKILTRLQTGLKNGCSDKKCKVMHVGHSEPTKYYMRDESGSKELQSIIEERDLGVLIKSDIKPSTQCVQVAAKSRRIIGMTRMHNTIRYKVV